MTATFTLNFPPGSVFERVLAFLRSQPPPIYLVGGSVRDLLLGRPTRDLDLAAPGNAIGLARRLADALDGAFFSLDAERDTGRAILYDPAGEPWHVDCAAWRADTLAGDLLLRDLTINALAVDVHQPIGGLVDVVGGLDDLQQRLVRAVSERSLPDDPLRGLRAVRLAAELASLGFRLEANTAQQLRTHAPRLAECSVERVRDELVRLVHSERPGDWLQLLADLGQLAVVLPEVAILRGVAQSAPHHWDVFEHTQRVVSYVAWLQAWLAGRATVDGVSWPEQALDAVLAGQRSALLGHLAEATSAARSRTHMLRWAALCHDLGKPATRSEEVTASGQARIRFIGHERVGAGLAEELLRRLRFNEAEVQWVKRIVALHLRPLELAIAAPTPSRRAVFRYFRDAGQAGVDVALLSLADQRATSGPDLGQQEWQQLLAVVDRLLADYFDQRTNPQTPLVTGRDLLTSLAIVPGRIVGRLLAEINEAQGAGDLHTRQEALEYAAALLASPWATRQDA